MTFVTLSFNGKKICADYVYRMKTNLKNLSLVSIRCPHFKQNFLENIYFNRFVQNVNELICRPTTRVFS